MKKTATTGGFSIISTAGLFSLIILVFSTGCFKDHTLKALKDFNQVNLVADNSALHPSHIDMSLLNAWGLAFNPTGIAWVSSQAGHVSTVYDKEGTTLRPPVNIPSPGGPTGGNPTGIVFNGSADFVLSNGQPARFIFVGLDGILSGWNPTAGNNALLIKNNMATAVYTGLTLAQNGGANYLYAADFRSGKIDVWDKNFNPVMMTFKDPGIPAGFSPFNIQVVGDWLYVLYAKVGPDGHDQPGPGLGFVSVFSKGGMFVKRFASRGDLNAPWGIAMAPASFFDDTDQAEQNSKTGTSKTGGEDEDDDQLQPMILVGNFGDGRINAYSINGKFKGQLKGHGKTISIDGLWALSFPPSTATTIDPNRLYFTAGPDHEKHGLFGYLIKQ